jgi:ElaB/YqjD/DUF883 family membrane-anchored ribosome-binding protein
LICLKSCSRAKAIVYSGRQARAPTGEQENIMTDVTTDKLMDDLRVLAADAEELLKATAGQAGDKVANVRARAQASVDAAKLRLTAAGERVTAGSREAAKATDAYVHQNPWQSIGVATGLGVLLGYLIGRK